MSAALVKSLRQDNQQLRDENVQLKSSLAYLEEQVSTLKRLVFGRSAERSATVPLVMQQQSLWGSLPWEQAPELFAGNPAASKPTPDRPATFAAAERPAGHGRRRLNPDIETVTVQITAPDESRRDAEGNILVTLGFEETRQYDLQPPKVLLKITQREVLGYKDSRDAAYTTPMPPAIVPRGLLTDSFLINMVVEKFFKGMPLYRQLQDFKAQGADIAKQTMSDGVKQFAARLAAVKEVILQQILSSRFLHVDETRMLQGQGKGAAYKTGYFWPVRDARQCYVHYGPSRSGDEIESLLWPKERPPGTWWYGFLMVDDFGAYHRFRSDPRMRLMACWSHVRRKFFAWADKDPIAAWFVAAIDRLYALEAECRDRAVTAGWDNAAFYAYRGDVRRRHAAPIIDQIEAEAEKHAAALLPESGTGRALRYLRKLLSQLRVYLEEGELPMDNNPVERSIRPITVGRKNYYAVGSEDAGEWAAVFYTLMECCRLAEVDPRSYLVLIVQEMHANPATPPEKLTPLALRDRLRPLPVNL
jgi:transposase